MCPDKRKSIFAFQQDIIIPSFVTPFCTLSFSLFIPFFFMENDVYKCFLILKSVQRLFLKSVSTLPVRFLTLALKLAINPKLKCIIIINIYLFLFEE